MANLIKKFNNDTKLPSKASLKKAATAAPAATTTKAAAPAKKSTTAVKASKATKAPASALVTLLLPKGSEIVPHKSTAGVNWARTPHMEGHKYPHWFRDDKYPVAKTPKGITVTVPRSVASSKGMLDYAQG